MQNIKDKSKVILLFNNKPLLDALINMLVTTVYGYENQGIKKFNGFDIKDLKSGAELLYHSNVDLITGEVCE